LKADTSDEVRHIITVNNEVIETFPKLAFGLPWYKIFPNPRWDKTFKKAEDSAGTMVDWSMEKINHAKAKILAKAGHSQDNFEVSVLEKLIIKNGPNSRIPIVMAFDMMIAGIDTTSNTAAFLLFNLAT